jgi:hypothetical protein
MATNLFDDFDQFLPMETKIQFELKEQITTKP